MLTSHKVIVSGLLVLVLVFVVYIQRRTLFDGFYGTPEPAVKWNLTVDSSGEATSSNRSPIGPPSRNPTMANLTICTKVYNSLPFLFEWIEFHRLQGVDKFIIYDDNSRDGVMELPAFYAQRGHPDLVQVIPVESVTNVGDHTVSAHTSRQLKVLDRCMKDNLNKTHWMLNIDVDEFMYAPNSTIWEYLENRPKNEQDVTEYTVSAVRFGTSGLTNDNFTDLVTDIVTGRMRLVFRFTKEEEDVPLLTELCNKRGPHPDLDKDYAEKWRTVCGPKNEGHCAHALGKNLFRPWACQKGPLHYCIKILTGRSITPSLTKLRLDHFPFRSKTFMEKVIKKYDDGKFRTFQGFDTVWFSTVLDDLKKPYIEALKSILRSYQSP